MKYTVSAFIVLLAACQAEKTKDNQPITPEGSGPTASGATGPKATGPKAPAWANDRFVQLDLRGEKYSTDESLPFAAGALLDQKTGQECWLQLTSSSTAACLPNGISSAIQFSDSSCTKPIYPVRAQVADSCSTTPASGPKYAAHWKPDALGYGALWGQYDGIYEVGELMATPATVYERDGSGTYDCTAVDAAPAYRAVAPVADGTFPTFQLQWRNSKSGNIRAPLFVRDSQVVRNFLWTLAYDTRLDTECGFWTYESNTCELMNAAGLESVKAADQCGGDDVIATLSESKGAKFGTTDDGKAYSITTGESFAAYKSEEFEGQIECSFWGNYVPVTKGALVEPYEGSRALRGSKRVKRNAVIADGLEFTSHYVDTETMKPCSERVDEQNVRRCVTAPFARAAYLDAACAQPVLMSRDELEVASVAQATQWADCTPMKTVKVGASIARPDDLFIFQVGKGCVLYPYSTNLYQVGDAVPLSTFPAYEDD